MKPSRLPLYLDEKTVASMILGARAAEWKRIAPLWERRGFPPIDPETGGRYWPACVAWLDRRNGLAQPMAGFKPDGGEQWPGKKSKERRGSNGESAVTVFRLPTGSPREPR